MSVVGGIYGGSGDGLTPIQQQQLNDAYNLSLQNETDLTNADNLSTGTVSDARLSANVTLEGNTFNAANKLVKAGASGTIDNTLLSDTITKQGNTVNSAGNLVQLGSSGELPSSDGSQVTGLNADNIATGTLDNGRLDTDVVVLDANNKIPAYDGSQITGLTKGQVGLGNVDNTSDASKPVSTATQTALDAKANKVTSFTAGNVVTVDANGHPQDSGETIAQLKDGWQGTVATFADLPTASASNNGHVYKVTTATGVIGINKKYAGSYISNGSSWDIFGYKQASVINQPLSGFTLPSTATEVTSSDTILGAFQKIQKQIDDAGSTITAKAGEALGVGDPVYVSGYDTTANVPIVSIARSGYYVLPQGIQKMPCVGLSPTSVSNGGTVDIVLTGLISGYDTSSFSVTDTLYVADFEASATLTNSPPTDSGTSDYSLIQPVGTVVTSASSGIILVNINAAVTSENLDEGKVLIGDANNQAAKRTLTANDIATGTFDDNRLSTNVTKEGNTFNGISQLVKTDATGRLPAIDGSLLTNLPSGGGNFSHNATLATFDLNTKKTTGGYAVNQSSGNMPSSWPLGASFGVLLAYECGANNGIQIVFSADRDSSTQYNLAFLRCWESSAFTTWSNML